MARLVTAACPRCGAYVPVEPDSDRATCKYCGAVAIVQPSEPAHPPSPPPVAHHPPRNTALILAVVALAVLGFFVMMFAGGVATYFGTASSSSSLPPAPVSSAPFAPLPPMPGPLPALPPGSVPAPAAPPPPVLHVLGTPAMLVLDVDGDHRSEIVAAVSQSAGGDTTQHFAVFDTHTGARRALTPAIEDLNTAVVAGRGNRLVVAQRSGQLTGYDLVSGDRQWTTALGERVAAICEPEAPGLYVETDGQRHLSLDLTTGRQTETRESCGRLLARAGSGGDPRDRHDHDAPPGLESYHCGGVTVMGSANYRVADQCAARGHIDTDHLDGMVGHRIWKSGRGWLVFGVRTPGTYVPMVARWERGHIVWKSEVPASNPLEAEEGGPRHAALVGDTLVVAYETGAQDEGVVTAFAVADGARRWTAHPPPGPRRRLAELVGLEDGVAVLMGDGVVVVNASDGAIRATIGASDSP